MGSGFRAGTLTPQPQGVVGSAGTRGAVGFCRMRENSIKLRQERQRVGIGNNFFDGALRHRHRECCHHPQSHKGVGTRAVVQQDGVGLGSGRSFLSGPHDSVAS